MGKYNMVRSEMWSDPEVRKLSPAGKLLYNYLLSSPVSSLIGYYRLPIVQMKTDLCRAEKMTGDFVPEDKSFFEKEILPQFTGQGKLWKYDMETEQLLIPNYLKYNKIGGGNALKSFGSSVSLLKICELHISFFKAIHTYIGEEAFGFIDRQVVNDVIALSKNCNSEDAIYIQDNISILFL